MLCACCEMLTQGWVNSSLNVALSSEKISRELLAGLSWGLKDSGHSTDVCVGGAKLVCGAPWFGFAQPGQLGARQTW